MDALSPIVDIMQRRGVRCSAAEFHAAVNLTFHRFEAEIYDQDHRDMWEIVPRQIGMLAEDCLGGGAMPESIRMLDVGCGTGLGSDSILKSALGPRIREIDLLDTSPVMLARVEERARGWKAPARCHEGMLDSMAGRGPYDLILACALLHHVPDLAAFAGDLRRLQTAGGIFLHLHDANADYLRDEELVRRTAEAARRKTPEWIRRLHPRRIAGRLQRAITGRLPGDPHIVKTNLELLRTGLIAAPLTIAELYAVTDIHGTEGNGVSMKSMAGWLPDYELVSQRSYGFFGELWYGLPDRLKEQEEELIAQKAVNGCRVGAAWKLARGGGAG